MKCWKESWFWYSLFIKKVFFSITFLKALFFIIALNSMLKNFFKSLDTLNIQQPDIFTKTTDHVKDMAYILKKLMDNGTFVQ